MARKERMDSGFSGMLSEDRSAPANLPQEVKYQAYPRQSYYDAFELDDSIRGIDDVHEETIRKMERHASDEKY